MTTEMRMTKADRNELAKVVRLRMKVTKTAVESLAADRKAEVERQLSAIHTSDAEVWRDITAEADRAVREADEKIAAICRDAGIPEKFRPGLNLSWYGRGENSYAERRTELRRLAYCRIEADAKAAVQLVEAWGCDRLTELHAGSLSSIEAKDFLAELPEPETLLPQIRITPELTDGGSGSRSESPLPPCCWPARAAPGSTTSEATRATATTKIRNVRICFIGVLSRFFLDNGCGRKSTT